MRGRLEAREEEPASPLKLSFCLLPARFFLTTVFPLCLLQFETGGYRLTCGHLCPKHNTRVIQNLTSTVRLVCSFPRPNALPSLILAQGAAEVYMGQRLDGRVVIGGLCEEGAEDSSGVLCGAGLPFLADLSRVSYFI